MPQRHEATPPLVLAGPRLEVGLRPPCGGDLVHRCAHHRNIVCVQIGPAFAEDRQDMPADLRPGAVRFRLGAGVRAFGARRLPAP